jgi:peptidoglycan-N-acetylglucosamine deacetylase
MADIRRNRIIISTLAVLGLLVICCCLATLVARALLAPPIALVDGKPASAALTGLVMRNPDGRPIAGATVSVGRFSTLTDASGRFEIPLMQTALIGIKISGGELITRTVHLALRPGANTIAVSVDSIWLVKDQNAEYAPIQPKVIRHGNRHRPIVAFTFDDGYNADYRIIDLMKKNGLRGTAFLIGGHGVVTEHPELVRALRDADFEVCTHGYNHLTNTDLTDTQLNAEIQKGQQVITRLDGTRWPYFRPSGGIYDNRTVTIVGENGYNVIMWSVDSQDSRAKMTTAERLAQILANVENGDIIVFHFGGYNTADLVEALIPALKAKGLKIGTVTDVLHP